MASMSINLSPKPLKPSQFHYFAPKIRAPISLHRTKFQIRAPNPTNFQIKTSSDNNRNRAVESLNSGGTKRAVNLNDSQKALLDSLNLNESQKLLLTLAARTNGFLKISDKGDFVYVYPHDYQSEFSIKPVKSIRMKIEPFLEKGKVCMIREIETVLEKGKMAAVFLVKLSFGMSLAASSVVVVPLLILEAIFKMAITDQPLDEAEIDVLYALCILFRGRSIKYVFPLVFGDGDPNQGIEEKMWKMIEQYIVLNGGVVAAEELAPYLDPNTTKTMEDDSYILPVLLRLGGQPKVDDEGYIVYHFPSLQSTAPHQTSEGKEEKEYDCVELEKFLKEKEWKFSDIDGQVIGGVNVILGRTLFWHLSIRFIC